MIELTRLTNDIFDDEKLSDVKLQPFANDHLIRLGNNNPGGIYSQLITDTTNAYTGYYGSLTSEATKVAISEGLTITTNNKRQLVIDKLSTQQGLVTYKFGKDSATYQEFFPQGMDEYHKARLDQLPTLLQRYLDAATAHLTADFPAEVTEISGLITDYNNARNAQLGAFSETDTLRTGRRENRKVLTLQLTRNILTLALDFLENSDGLDDYYDREMLPRSASGGTDDPTPITGATISGTIVDKSTLKAIEGAMVEVSTTYGIISAVTDAQGNYELQLPDLNATTSADLNVEAAGYASDTRPMTLEIGQAYTEDFNLTPMP